MKDATSGAKSCAPLMVAWSAESQVHLIIGSNSLAAARCTKSLEAGARPVIIAPENADVHFSLAEHVSTGAAQLISRDFRDDDLKTLGREEVEGIVDVVFVTLGGRHPLSMLDSLLWAMHDSG